VKVLNESASSSRNSGSDAVGRKFGETGAPAAQTLGHYREALPDARLTDAFSRRWIHDCSTLGRISLTVLPDGCIDLQAINGELRIAGPDAGPFQEHLRAGSTVVALRFRPGTASQWLRVPASELRDKRVSVADLIGRAGRQLERSVDWEGGTAAIHASLERALLNTCLPALRIRPDVLAAVSAIRSAVTLARPTVPHLARLSGASERSLRRHFTEALGYGPATFAGILRFRRFLSDASLNPRLNLAQLAAKAGYADQAHLCRECRRFSGRTPSELRQS
jgi:AraC-like DNA-binding protein